MVGNREKLSEYELQLYVFKAIPAKFAFFLINMLLWFIYLRLYRHSQRHNYFGHQLIKNSEQPQDIEAPSDTNKRGDAE